MVISNVVEHQYAFLLPVGLVIVCVVLVFAFGFKSSVEPPNFKQLSLSSDERKSLKRKKPKEKKAQTNGHATVIIDDSEGKAKPLKQSNKADTNKVKKVEDVKKSPAKAEKKEKRSGKENQETPKVKKNEKVEEDKPTDFDEGEWETAFSRKDKKNRKKEDDVNASTPEKTPKEKSTEKKTPKQEKATTEDKAQSLKKSNQQNRTTAASPGGKKVSVTEEAEEKGSLQTGSKSSVEAVEEEKVPVVEPKPQRLVVKEKKQAERSSSPFSGDAESTVEKPEKAVESEQSGDSQCRSEEAVLNEQLDDYWKEAPQKKSKKKVRKD